MLTVTAVYKGLHYEATELGDRVAIHAPDATCWTHWRRGRLVRSEALRATAPKRVVSRLESRLRRAGQLGAVHAGMQVLRGAELDEALREQRHTAFFDTTLGERWPVTRVSPANLEARVHEHLEHGSVVYDPVTDRVTSLAVTPAEDARGWAAWARFLQLPEAASHEEILGALPELDAAVQRETGELTNTVSDGSSPYTPHLEFGPLADEIRVAEARREREAANSAFVARFTRLWGLPETASREEILARMARPGSVSARDAILADASEQIERQVSEGLTYGPVTTDPETGRTSCEITVRMPDVDAIVREARRLAPVALDDPLDMRYWTRRLGLPETASPVDIVERMRQRHASVSEPSPITQGSPAYMQALVAQITPETARLWANAWGCTPAALAQRVLEPGPGDLVDSDTARELSRRILADVGQPAVDGARRADRSLLARHNDPDTPEDLEYYDDTPEPLEDIEWFRGVLAETERSEP